MYEVTRTLKEYYQVEAQSAMDAMNKCENPYRIDVIRETIKEVKEARK